MAEALITWLRDCDPALRWQVERAGGASADLDFHGPEAAEDAGQPYTATT